MVVKLNITCLEKFIKLFIQQWSRTIFLQKVASKIYLYIYIYIYIYIYMIQIDGI